MRILGLTALSHDAGTALIDNGTIVSVLEEERHNRFKHTIQFPVQALRIALGQDGAGLRDIDVITTPWDPARLRRTFFWAVTRKFPGSLHLMRDGANPAQDGAVIALNQVLRVGLKWNFPKQRQPEIVNVGHHESHAAMFFVSPFEDATIVVMDGMGDDSSTSVFTGQGNQIERQWHGTLFDSLGLVYTLVTRHLGFQVFEEGTVMALAALGTNRLVEPMRDLVRLTPDGRFTVNMAYFDYDRYGLIQPFKQKFTDTFGPPRAPGAPLTDHVKDLAFALQAISEEVILHVVRAARKAHPSRNLVFAGGVALNCVANAKLKALSGYDRVWVPPCASDTGVPLGSALYHHHQTMCAPRHEVMDHAYYGAAFSDDEIEAALKAVNMTYRRLDDASVISTAAQDLAAGKVVGWYQGRYEIGPRALGNRSILASPILPGIRDTINQRVKFREPFRPFAPSVLAERAAEFFEIDQPDPFMTLAPRVRPEMVGRIPAAVHVDGTARIQTVEKAANPRYHALIEAFGRITGVPIVLNTRFNKQEPIVCRPSEAISCFLRTQMDVLVMGNFYTTDRPGQSVSAAQKAFEVAEVNTRGGE